MLSDAAYQAKESLQLWMRTRIVAAAQRELGERNDREDTVSTTDA